MRHSRGLIRCGKGCQAGADLAEHSSTWRCSRCSCCASPPASFSLEASFLFSSASCFFSPFCLTSAACSAPCASVCAQAQTVPTCAVSKASLRNFLSFRWLPSPLKPAPSSLPPAASSGPSASLLCRLPSTPQSAQHQALIKFNIPGRLQQLLGTRTRQQEFAGRAQNGWQKLYLRLLRVCHTFLQAAFGFVPAVACLCARQLPSNGFHRRGSRLEASGFIIDMPAHRGSIPERAARLPGVPAGCDWTRPCRRRPLHLRAPSRRL